MTRFIQSARDWFYGTRRKLATCSVIVLVCVMAWHVVFGANGVVMYEQKRQENQQLEKQIQSLHQQNDSLEQQIKALKTDPKTIEKEAREQLRYARPGEVIYTLPAPQPVTPANLKK